MRNYERIGETLTYLWIALGSALGGCARYAMGSAVAQWLGTGFPWGTLSVNILGGLLIGFLASTFESTTARQFLMIGFCGGFTTFSSFSLETLNLLRAGEPTKAALYAVASVIACLAAVWLGHMAASSTPAR